MSCPGARKTHACMLYPFRGFQQASAGAPSVSPSPAPDVCGPHVWSGANRQTNLAKAEARRSKSAADTWDRPSSAVNQSSNSFSSRHKQGCVRCSATHVEYGVGVFLLSAHGSLTRFPGVLLKINDVAGKCTSKHDSTSTRHDTTSRTKD